MFSKLVKLKLNELSVCSTCVTLFSQTSIVNLVKHLSKVVRIFYVLTHRLTEMTNKGLLFTLHQLCSTRSRSKGANKHFVFDKLNNDTYSNFICILHLNTQNINNWKIII